MFIEKFITVVATLISFGLGNYAMSSCYLFIYNLPWVNPATVDPVGMKQKIDRGMISNCFDFFIWALIHSLTARKSFQKRIPHYIERQVFVIIAASTLLVLLSRWSPLFVHPHILQAPITMTQLVPYIIFQITGWILFGASNTAFLEDDVFGVVRCIKFLKEGKQFEDKKLASDKFPFNIVRHPMYLGAILIHWSQFFLVRNWTINRLVYNFITTSYLLIGMNFEERDLRRRMGQSYIDYSKNRDKIIPIRSIRWLMSKFRHKKVA